MKKTLLSASQIKALLRKDAQISKRRWKTSLLELILPLVLGTVCALIVHFAIFPKLNKGNLPTAPLSQNFNNTWMGFVGELPHPPELDRCAQAMQQHNATVQWFKTQSDAENSVPQESLCPFVVTLNDTTGGFVLETSPVPPGPLSEEIVGAMWAMFAAVFAIEGLDPSIDVSLTRPQLNVTAVYFFAAAVLVISFLPSTIITSGRMVEEKMMKVKELFKVMGLWDSSYFISHFVSAQCRILPGVIALQIPCLCLNVISWEEVPYFLLGCVLFSFSTTTFAFLMPVLYSKAVWSNATCIIFLFVIPQFAGLLGTAPSSYQLASCVISPIAFYYYTRDIISGGQIPSPMTREFSLLMLAADTVIYCLLGLYLIQIFPGEFGIPKHPLFFLQWMWRSGDKRKSSRLRSGPGSVNYTVSPIKEYGLGGPGEDHVVLQKVNKLYKGSEVYALKDLNLRVTKGTIFALLGSNGAGKTTTINLICGLIPPTDYEVGMIDDLDITESIDTIRKNVGLCPQADVLFPDLTAREHLELFACIRDEMTEANQANIQRLLTSLDLPTDAFTAGKLSSGARRRISVGIALAGNNSLVILDEPSSGLDPLSRRNLWNLIQVEKAVGRTVILCSHAMDEADFLGDEIGIMVSGQLRACGTPMALKQLFGCGFHLRVMIIPELCGILSLTEYLQSVIPEVHVKDVSTSDVVYFLPNTHTHLFETLLEGLDQRMSDLGVLSYGINTNTLEDVFHHISNVSSGNQGKRPSPMADSASRNFLPHRASDFTSEGAEMPLLADDLEERVTQAAYMSDIYRFLSQFWTLLVRRLRITWNNITLRLFLILMPSFLIVLAVVTAPTISEKEAFSLKQLIYLDLAQNADSMALHDALVLSYFNLTSGHTLRMTTLHSVRDYYAGLFGPSPFSRTKGFLRHSISGYRINDLDLKTRNVNVTFMVDPNSTRNDVVILAALLHEAIYVATTSNSLNFTLTTKNIPPPSPPPNIPTLSPKSQNATENPSQGSYDTDFLAINTIISGVLITSFSASFVADEIHRRIYTNMRLHGLMPIAYSVQNWFHDLLWCSLPLLFTYIAVYTRPFEQLQGEAKLCVYTLAYFLFGAHLALQSYILVSWNDALRPFEYLLIIAMTTAVMGIIPWVLLQVWGSLPEDMEAYVWAMTPPSAFLRTVHTLGKSDHDMDLDSLMGLNEGAGLFFLFSGGELLLLLKYYSYLLLNFDGFVEYVRGKRHGRRGGPGTREDPDVALERHRIEDGDGQLDLVQAVDLVKAYGTGRHAKKALRKVTFGIKRGECFGLLGPNGAGKTTLIKALIGDTDLTSGYVMHSSCGAVGKSTLYRYGRLGLCQEHDALWPYLSATAHMEIYLKLRLTSLYRNDIEGPYIADALRRLKLDALNGVEEAKLVKHYSGGMMRKLSVCLALFTGASTVFLDEPSTGMDPVVRRALWKVIDEAVGYQHAVVLTTHSMEEAETVCSRMAIINDGALQCIGTSHDIKNKYGDGYILCISLHETFTGDLSHVDERVTSLISGGTKLHEGLGLQRKYTLAFGYSIGKVFGIMEREKASLHVTSYTIGQTSTLDQIFVRFVGTDKVK